MPSPDFGSGAERISPQRRWFGTAANDPFHGTPRRPAILEPVRQETLSPLSPEKGHTTHDFSNAQEAVCAIVDPSEGDMNPARLERRKPPKGSYGIDAPYLLPVPLVIIAWNVIQGIISNTWWPFAAAGLVVACMGFGLYASRRGKFVVWAGLLEELGLKGEERILDIGCGRGAILVMAAHHLTSGCAVGVDLWKRGDQWGNSAEATLQNATVEGVADRVMLHTADMATLPFEDSSFDVVVSNVAIHNVKGRDGRGRVIRQLARVLRPGGRLMIADIHGTTEYAAQLRAAGMKDVSRRSLGWRMWWSGPWLATRLVTATKLLDTPSQGEPFP